MKREIELRTVSPIVMPWGQGRRETELDLHIVVSGYDDVRALEMLLDATKEACRGVRRRLREVRDGKAAALEREAFGQSETPPAAPVAPPEPSA